MYVERSISLESASQIVDTAIGEARLKKLNPICVIVLDSGGVQVAVKSQDGCGILRYEVAFGKAYGALGMGTSGRDLQDRLGDRPNFASAPSAASQGRLAPNPGGVLILGAKERAIGAVGVSGDTSDKDDFCAISAITTNGFLSFPPVNQEY